MSLLSAFYETANTIEKPSLEPTFLESGFYRGKVVEITQTKSGKQQDMYVFKLSNVEAAKSQPDAKGKVKEVKEGEFSFIHRVVLEETEKTDKEGIIKNLFAVWASAFGDDDKQYGRFKEALKTDSYESSLKDQTLFLSYTYKKGAEFPVNLNLLTQKEWTVKKATAKSA